MESHWDQSVNKKKFKQSETKHILLTQNRFVPSLLCKAMLYESKTQMKNYILELCYGFYFYFPLCFVQFHYDTVG